MATAFQYASSFISNIRKCDDNYAWLTKNRKDFSEPEYNYLHRQLVQKRHALLKELKELVALDV